MLLIYTDFIIKTNIKIVFDIQSTPKDESIRIESKRIESNRKYGKGAKNY